MHVEDIVELETEDGEVYIRDVEEGKWYELNEVEEKDVPEEIIGQLEELEKEAEDEEEEKQLSGNA